MDQPLAQGGHGRIGRGSRRQSNGRRCVVQWSRNVSAPPFFISKLIYMIEYQIILFYKYVKIDDPAKLLTEQKELQNPYAIYCVITIGGKSEGNLLNTFNKLSTPPVDEPIAITFCPPNFAALKGMTSSG